MHVAIDLRIMDAPGMEMTGLGRYALEATRSIQRVRPDWRLSLFSNRPELLSRTGARACTTRLPTEHALARILWLHAAAALPTFRSSPDVWFSPAFTLPVWWRGRSVVTIHDLTFLLLRARYRGSPNALYATLATRWSARQADRILCPSRETHKQIVGQLRVDAAKVEVIPEGVADVFFALPDMDIESRARASNPYLLFVGTREARKGLGTLYSALRRVNAQRKRVRLVLAGRPGWGTERLIETMRRDRDVEFRERPTDSELAELYRGALALAYPSEMEGFGLPVAEAMACGCPVIATDLPSIREFAGIHPLYIASGEVEQLARHVERLLAGDAEAERRRRDGRDAVAALSWTTLGQRTALAIERAAGDRRIRACASG